MLAIKTSSTPAIEMMSSQPPYSAVLPSYTTPAPSPTVGEHDSRMRSHPAHMNACYVLYIVNQARVVDQVHVMVADIQTTG